MRTLHTDWSIVSASAALALLCAGAVAADRGPVAAQSGALVAAVEGLAPAAPAKQAPKLHRNPFKRPALLQVSVTGAPQVVQAPPPWAAVLKATMVADGGVSMANVDGQMVELGAEYQGFKLVEVREREAEFERDGHTWVLSLD